MRVLGIDPGLQCMGWGVIEQTGSRLVHVANGTCKTQGTDLSARLLSLFDQLSDVLDRHRPDEAAVEKTFVNKDGSGTLTADDIAMAKQKEAEEDQRLAEAAAAAAAP